MKRLEKILNITPHIYNIYQELIDMEINGLDGSKEYLQKLDDLNLYKEFEDKYYDELSKKYDLNEITRMIGHLNIDNLVEASISDFEFATYDFIDPSCEEIVTKRRIFNRLNAIMLEKTNNDELFQYIKEILEPRIVSRNSLNIGDREILILDRAHTLLNLLQRTTENLYLRYMYYIQSNLVDYSFGETFMSKKYILPFIIKNIENRMLQRNFIADSSFISAIKEEKTSLNQEVYDIFLLKHSIDLFNNTVNEALNLEYYNLNEADKEIYMVDCEAAIKASSLEMSESLTQMMIMILNNPDDIDYEETKGIRKRLTKIIRAAKADKNNP